MLDSVTMHNNVQCVIVKTSVYLTVTYAFGHLMIVEGRVVKYIVVITFFDFPGHLKSGKKNSFINIINYSCIHCI